MTMHRVRLAFLNDGVLMSIGFMRLHWESESFYRWFSTGDHITTTQRKKAC